MSRHRRPTDVGRALAAPVLLGMLLSACSGTTDASTAGAPPTAVAPDAPPSAPATAPGAARAGRPTVTLGVTSAGRVVVDDRGRTLYTFDADRPGQPACTGRCLSVWPPAPAGRPLVAGPGVTGALGTTRATNGTVQLTLAGHPLYLYAGDVNPGDANGAQLRTFGGTWRLVGGTGGRVSRPLPTPTPSQAPTPAPSTAYDFTT